MVICLSCGLPGTKKSQTTVASLASLWTAFVVGLTWIDIASGVPHYNTEVVAGKWLGDAFARLGWIERAIKGLTAGAIPLEGRTTSTGITHIPAPFLSTQQNHPQGHNQLLSLSLLFIKQTRIYCSLS